MAGHNTHHQPRACAGIAKIQNLHWVQERAEARPVNLPMSKAKALDLCPQLAAGLGCAQDIIALKQALYLCAPNA
jgi:hypothetical protein